MKPFRAFLAFLFSLTPAFALQDSNGNGLSDVWERHFNNGDLFSIANPAHAPGADPDGDGWTNAKEALAGTDPFSALPPEGYVAVDIVRHPDSEGSFYLSWPSLEGKVYRLKASPDLEEWMDADDPIPGTGAEIVLLVDGIYEDEEEVPERFFWRVKIEDDDLDADGLSDFEEILLGSSRYLADTAGDGTSDLDRYLAGHPPAGDPNDSDGDGVPDNELYTVVFEIREERRAMPPNIGYSPLEGSSDLNRYLTKEVIEEYSVSGSPRYEDVTGGEHKVKTTYLDGNDITADGGTVTSVSGQTFSDWKQEHGVSLGQGEVLELEPEQTEVEEPEISDDSWEQVTTTTREWRVKKDGKEIRSGTETIEVKNKTELSDRVTRQEFWAQHMGGRVWEEFPWSVQQFGPLEWVEYERAVHGDAQAAEGVRERFRKGDFAIHGTLSNPGVTPWLDQGSDTRITSIRWRWVRFDPQRPFEYHEAPPPADHRKTVCLAIWQTDFLDTYPEPSPELLRHENRLKGIVEIECAGARSGWQEVSLDRFDEHRLDEPGYHQDHHFGTWGYSRVYFESLPVNLAVDANRDGALSFDGRDRTSAQRPFRFWINNDQDDVEMDEPVIVQAPDFANRQTILTKRDLEDFCRLKLHTGANWEHLRSGRLKVGLMFRNVLQGTPSIRVWKNQSPIGDDSYLKNDTAAAGQLAVTAFEIFAPHQITILPGTYWQNHHDSTAHLIFEGVSKGIGELVVTLHDEYGAKIAEGNGVWIHLLDVREMYQRARIVNEAPQIPHPWDNPTPPAQTWAWDAWNWPYVEDPAAENITAIFVHGWRLTYRTSLNWADTSYKRLWHQGFRGKFYAFRWATFSGDDNALPDNADDWLEEAASDSSFIPPPGGATYNPSEYRAWLCGPALADFVNQLPNPGRRSLFAHSMGNVIAGSALRSGMSVQFYAMCNAAMAAMAYDPDPNLRNVGSIFPPGTAHMSLDTDPDPAIRNSYGLENKFNLTGMPRIFNFGLPRDSALSRWSTNNLLFKPQWIGTTGRYSYNQYPLGGAYKLDCIWGMGNRQVTELPEAMAYVTKSLTRAAGAELRTRGCISDEDVVDMHNWFDEVHSAQWRKGNQSTRLFWEQLFDKLELREN